MRPPKVVRGGEMLGQVDRVAVAGELGEADHVGGGDGLRQRSVMPTERSSKNSVRSGGRLDGGRTDAGMGAD